MVRFLTALAALITILAMTTYLCIHSPWVIRIERVDHKSEERVVTKSIDVTPPFGPVPRIIVQTIPSSTETPAVHAEPEAVPTKPPVVRKRKPKPKHVAAEKLKSTWAAPQAEPFSLERLFNVR